jgi:ketosteroid isomerase-like protein
LRDDLAGQTLHLSLGGRREDDMDATEVARKYDEAFDAQDADARVANQTPDIEVVLPGGMVLQGPDQVGEVVRSFWEALPDGKITHENEVAAGDMVVIEGTLTGTHTGSFRTSQGDIPASGNPVKLRYASVKRILGGKVASEHLYFDQLEFLQQLGAMPGHDQ